MTLSTDQLEVGSQDAAQDLYGLGVRIGFYLQALGMNLYSYGGIRCNSTRDFGKGLKVASGSITVSILASWFVFAARGLFSPSEAIIVLLVLMSLSFPAKTTLLNPRTIIGETFGLIIMVLVELGTSGALIWTFAELVNTLPTFGTDNVIFFFAKVPINGWFRILGLVLCVLDAITSIRFANKVVRIATISWQYYANDRTNAIEAEIGKIREIVDWDEVWTGVQVLRWLIWILVIVTVELTVKWNHLSPSADLQAPGQLIPFVTGIVVITDSSFIVAQRMAPKNVKDFFGFNASVAGSVSRLLEQMWKAIVWVWERLRWPKLRCMSLLLEQVQRPHQNC